MITKKAKLPKVYIAGKITGMDWKEAKEKFRRVQIILEECGYEVENPCDHQIENGTWEAYMKQGLHAMLDCGGVLALDNWKESRGARIEVKLALDLGLFVLYEDRDLPGLVDYLMNSEGRRW